RNQKQNYSSSSSLLCRRCLRRRLLSSLQNSLFIPSIFSLFRLQGEFKKRRREEERHLNLLNVLLI
ncbi:unnamed protein product, partial [Arabidopsis halleri]